MFGLGTTEIIVIAGVIVLLFGAKKLPELAKGIGQSLNIFKKELTSENKEITEIETEDTQPNLKNLNSDEE